MCIRDSLDIDAREEAWSKIDKIEKDVLEKIEVKLDEILPTAFAIVKETARRFANNETIVVTATPVSYTHLDVYKRQGL